jgi:hypothetical protein
MLTIRSAVGGDAPTLMQVHRKAVFSKATEHYPRTVLEAWAPGATAARMARLADEIADPDFIALVAEAAGDIIGFAMAVPSRDELRALYVKPNAIGRVGQTLLAEIERQSFARADRLACDASLNAEAFYAANGYSAECRSSQVLRQGAAIACVRMSKRRPTGRRDAG